MTGRAQTASGLAAILMAVVLVDVARAQTIPEGQSCGGLVCDLGIIGHKTEPAPAAPSSPVVAPALKPLAEAAPVEKPRAPRPRKRVATKPVASRPPPVAAAPVPVAPVSAPVAAARPVPAPPTAPAVAARAPAPAPVYQRPLIFQSIDPTLQ